MAESIVSVQAPEPSISREPVRLGDILADALPKMATRVEITYAGAHRRVYRTRGPATAHSCSCGATAKHWAYRGDAPDERTDPMGRPFSADPGMYEPLCVPCHKRADLAAAGFKPAPCGTEKGYERHRREESPRCAACKEAHAQAEAVRRTARALSEVGE